MSETEKSSQEQALAERIRELTAQCLEEEIMQAHKNGVPADMGAAMRKAQARAAELAGTEAGTSPDKL